MGERRSIRLPVLPIKGRYSGDFNRVCPIKTGFVDRPAIGIRPRLIKAFDAAVAAKKVTSYTCVEGVFV